MPENPAPKRAREAVPYQLREFIRRAELLKQTLAMIRGGESIHAAARALGEPVANLWRYVRGFQKLGVAGLIPSLSTGRKRKVVLTDTEAAEIAALSFRVVRREDIAAGCRAYAARPDCRPALQAMLAGRIPASVRAAIRAHLPSTEQ